MIVLVEEDDALDDAGQGNGGSGGRHGRNWEEEARMVK
jgi:hypothetical protein